MAGRAAAAKVAVEARDESPKVKQAKRQTECQYESQSECINSCIADNPGNYAAQSACGDERCLQCELTIDDLFRAAARRTDGAPAAKKVEARQWGCQYNDKPDCIDSCMADNPENPDGQIVCVDIRCVQCAFPKRAPKEAVDLKARALESPEVKQAEKRALISREREQRSEPELDNTKRQWGCQYQGRGACINSCIDDNLGQTAHQETCVNIRCAQCSFKPKAKRDCNGYNTYSACYDSCVRDNEIDPIYAVQPCLDSRCNCPTKRAAISD